MPAISRRLAIVAVASTLVAAVAACSSGGGSPKPSTVSAAFAGGAAQVSMTGDYTASYPATLIVGAFVNDGAGMSVEYGDVQTGALTYQGPAKPGTYKTVRTDTALATLGLTVVLTSGDVPSYSFDSINGECEVTIVEMADHKGNATFTCSNLANQDDTVTIDATGSFSVVY
jgi:hypothetical protein